MLSHRLVICVMLILPLAAVASLAKEEAARGTDGNGLEGGAVCDDLAREEVRVNVRPEGEIEGRLVGCVGDSIYVARETRTHAIALDDINALWVRGSNAKRGFKIGGGIGAALGAVFGGLAAAFGTPGCEYECTGDIMLGILGGVFFGGLVGGSIGAGLGAVIPGWHLWYDSSEQVSSWRGRYEPARMCVRLCPPYTGQKPGLRLTLSVSF